VVNETYDLWKKEEYTYPVLGEFIPNIVTYIHDEDESVRPAMIVVPGGGYGLVSSAEGEIVAKEFYDKGYNAFVVTYTTNIFATTPLKFQPLKDLSKAVVLVRRKAEQFFIDSNKVTICGFSAGGHLCGSLAVHYDAKELALDGEYQDICNSPNAVILSYPVITSGEYAHRDSFIVLLGQDATEEELEYMSLEKQVTKNTPPVFVWHTATDETVPVENTYLFADACRKQGVTFEQHIFGNGRHGLSLANEQWAVRNFGGHYTKQQLFETIQFYFDNDKELPHPFNMLGKIPEGLSLKEWFLQEMKEYALPEQPDEGIAVWPQLAHNWLKKVLGI
jgi:acetyl esterase/lipase